MWLESTKSPQRHCCKLNFIKWFEMSRYNEAKAKYIFLQLRARTVFVSRIICNMHCCKSKVHVLTRYIEMSLPQSFRCLTVLVNVFVTCLLKRCTHSQWMCIFMHLFLTRHASMSTTHHALWWIVEQGCICKKSRELITQSCDEWQIIELMRIKKLCKNKNKSNCTQLS